MASLTDRLQALLDNANTATGGSDATLADAMDTLISGYGQGGDGYPKILYSGQFSVDADITATSNICTIETGVIQEKYHLYASMILLNTLGDTSLTTYSEKNLHISQFYNDVLPYWGNVVNTTKLNTLDVYRAMNNGNSVYVSAMTGTGKATIRNYVNCAAGTYDIYIVDLGIVPHMF